MTESYPRGGILAALWTPLDARGRLLTSALARHLRFLERRGVHGVLALGSTGEFPRFSVDQRERLLAAIVERAGSLPVLANVSALQLADVIALGRSAKRMGIPAVALMPPFFYPLSQADMLEFYLRAADGIGLPIYLYNFPELTGNRLGLDLIAKFADRAPIAGLKQSGAEFSYHRPLIRLAKEKGFGIFSGADTRLAEVFGLGAVGCIGGLVNFVPEPMVRIYHRCRAGEKTGGTDSGRMRAVGKFIDRLSFPLNVAGGMEARGLEPGAPKAAVSPESKRIYRRLVADLRRQFKAWQLGPG